MTGLDELEKFPLRGLTITGEDNSTLGHYMVERTCPICNKVFYVRELEHYAYKCQMKYGKRWLRTELCSYTCMRKAEKIRKKNRTYRMGLERKDIEL